jgi:hypothetical protein
MPWIAKLPSPSFRAGQYRNSARSAAFGNRTMYSTDLPSSQEICCESVPDGGHLLSRQIPRTLY